MEIWIRESRIRSLLTSAIEVYPNETDGVFSGRFVLRKFRGKKRMVLYVEHAYPIQTAERKPSQVSHGNLAAFRRVMNSLTSADIEFLGGYHSHPFPYKGIQLSKSDIGFIKDEVNFLRHHKDFKTQSQWVELLLCIKRIRYQRRQKTGWSYSINKKRIIFSLAITPYTRYEIILAGFLIDYSKKLPSVEELKIHVQDT